MSFFFKSTAIDIEKPVKGVRVETLHQLECKICPLNHADVMTPKMKPNGPIEADIYFLGEFPSKIEDEEGQPFAGSAGRLLRSCVPSSYLKRIRWNNTVRTRPPKGKLPTWQATECCRPSIVRDIEKIKPKAIFLFGNIALSWVIGEEGIYSWRGRRMALRIGNHVCWGFPIHHPSFINGIKEQRRRNDLEAIFRRDVKQALAQVDTLPEPTVVDANDYYKGVVLIDGTGGEDDIKRLKKWLRHFSKCESVGLDYECNGLRPYKKGFKILSVGISDYKNSISFAIDHKGAGWTHVETELVKKLFKKFLIKAPVRKVAHNLSYEMEVSLKFFGIKSIRPTAWDDTLAQAYVLDERASMLDLDTLCLQHFGFKLKSLSNVNRKNLDEESLIDVLRYNALDAKFEHKLFTIQRNIIKKEKRTKFYRERIRRIPTIVLSQSFGVCIDQKQVKRLQSKLGKRELNILNQISKLPIVKKYEEKYGKFNPGSNKQCLVIFHTMLARKEVIKPNKNGVARYSVDEGVLEQIPHKLAKLVVKLRKATKLKSTYVDILDINDKDTVVFPDKKIHTNFKAFFTRTGRLSSEDPNVQNFPKHKNAYVRKQIIPDEGHVFAAFDYGQIEARLIAMASRDRSFCKALWEDYDVHWEWGERIAYAYPEIIGGKRYIKDKDVMKKMRQKAKNKFVFPAFFGASEKSVAGYLGVPEDKMQTVFDDFWKVFEGIKKWQQETYQTYEEQGYVESPTGFRRHAPLSWNHVINTPIQGAASDIVVDAMCRLSEHAQEIGDWHFQPRMNIHDDLTFSLPTKNLEDYIDGIVEKMLTVPFDFVNVPISIELSIGPNNWYEMIEIEKFASTGLKGHEHYRRTSAR